MNLNVQALNQRLISIIKIGIFMIIVLPIFMNSKFFFPFIVPKNIAFRIIVEIIFLLYLVVLFLDKRYKPTFNQITISLLLFGAVSFMAAIFGLNFKTSFFGNYERMSGLFHLLHLLMFFFVLIGVIREKKDWHTFFTFSIFVSLLMSFLALAQYLGVPFLLRSSGGSRLSGTVGNPTFFAAYLIFHLFLIFYFFAEEERFDLKTFSLAFLIFDFALVLGLVFGQFFPESDWGWLNILRLPVLKWTFAYPGLFYSFLFFQLMILAAWFLRHKNHVVRALLAAVFIIEFFIFLNTQTRGAIIGFFAGILLLFLAIIFYKSDKKIKISFAALFLLAIIFPILLYLGRDTALIQNSPLSRLATISLTNITVESRLLAWQASWLGWKDTPKSFLIGYGPENYYYAFNKYFPTPIYKDVGSQIWFDRAHNIIFDVGVTTGIIGLLIYLNLLGFTVLALYHHYRQTREISSSWLLISLILAYFIQNFFVFDTLNTEIPFYLFLGFVVFLVNQPINKEGEKAETPLANGQAGYIYLSVISVIILFLIFGVNIKTLKANNYIFKGLVQSDNTIEEKFEYLKKATDQSEIGKFESRQQLASFVQGLLKNENVSASQLKLMFNEAEAELEKSVVEEPQNIRHYLYLTSFLNATTRLNPNNPQKVIAILEPAISLSPTRPHIYYEIGQAYLFMNNFDRAIEYFNQGIKLAPKIIDDQWNILTIYVIFKKNDLAEQQLRFMRAELKWQPNLDDLRRLADLFSRAEFYPKAIEFMVQVINSNATLDDYAKLAALYAQGGDKNLARQTALKAIELNKNSKNFDANFAAEAELFLKKMEAGEL